MTVALNPPELGQMEIEVITRGGKVEIEMTSDNHLAKHLLEANLPELKRTLGIQDLDLARVEVNVGDPGFHSQQSGREQTGSEREFRQPSNGSSSSSSSPWENQGISLPSRAAASHWGVRSGAGQLDLQI
jgi:flagellar hook-length control protein FliK